MAKKERFYKHIFELYNLLYNYNNFPIFQQHHTLLSSCDGDDDGDCDGNGDSDGDGDGDGDGKLRRIW